MNRTAIALVTGAAFGVVIGGVGIAAAGDGGSDDDRTVASSRTLSQDIGEQGAREIALEAAGGGRVEKAELEVEDGGLQWHIDVISGGTEFDVRVDASTGEIVRFRTDDGRDRIGRDNDRSDDRDDRAHTAECDDDRDDNSGPGGGDDS